MTIHTVVIAQPTFLPWVGWFDLADQADLLIILDSVAFSKQSWQQRNRIRTPEGLSYVSLAVRTAGRLGQPILEAELADPVCVRKIVGAIGANYARAPYFRRYFAEFSDVLVDSASSGKLCDLNCGLIAWLCEQLGIGTARVRSSTMPVEGRRGEYVAKLCDYVGASRYLSPAGAEEYLIEDSSEFTRRHIAVELHVYEHPVYRQCFEPFMPYASVLDLLFNEGDAAADIIRSGRRPARPLAAQAVIEATAAARAGEAGP